MAKHDASCKVVKSGTTNKMKWRILAANGGFRMQILADAGGGCVVLGKQHPTLAAAEKAIATMAKTWPASQNVSGCKFPSPKVYLGRMCK